jgi:hypothetical protein
VVRCSKDVQRDLLVQKAKFNLVSNKIDVQEYLEEVSQTIHDKLKNNKSTTTTSSPIAPSSIASSSIASSSIASTSIASSNSFDSN